MTQNSTDIESPTPTRKRLSVLTLIAIIAVSAIFVAWVLTADGTQRWLTARRTTHELEQSVRQAPDTPWPFYELGVRYARAGRLPDAIKLFERARQAAPE